MPIQKHQGARNPLVYKPLLHTSLKVTDVLSACIDFAYTQQRQYSDVLASVCTTQRFGDIATSMWYHDHKTCTFYVELFNDYTLSLPKKS